MTFWILTILLALVVTAALGLSLLRRRRNDAPAAGYDLQVYREQLAGVERDLARGVIAEADAERVRTEISRRILAADAKARKGGTDTGPARGLSLGVTLLICTLLVGGSLAIYTRMGAPGYPDIPLSQRLDDARQTHESRPAQAIAEAQQPAPVPPQVDESYVELVERLRAVVSERPDDVRGLSLLAQHEANLGNYIPAYQAMERVIELNGPAAPARRHAELAGLMVQAAGGYVSPEAEEALEAALARDENDSLALYLKGRMLGQIGRPDLALRDWDASLRSAAPNEPWADSIRAGISELAMLAGVDYRLPGTAAAPGPSAQDIEAANAMSDEDRQEMIRGMVQNLSDRLASEGGTAQEWARLIGALGVLGEVERATAIRAEAVTVFQGNDEALALIAQAAQSAGLAP